MHVKTIKTQKEEVNDSISHEEIKRNDKTKTKLNENKNSLVTISSGMMKGEITSEDKLKQEILELKQENLELKHIISEKDKEIIDLKNQLNLGKIIDVKEEN